MKRLATLFTALSLAAFIGCGGAEEAGSGEGDAGDVNVTAPGGEGDGHDHAEGEGHAEGEDHAEGEGEKPAEGEGEAPAEGEGEKPAEGEGEAPAEGDTPPAPKIELDPTVDGDK